MRARPWCRERGSSCGRVQSPVIIRRLLHCERIGIASPPATGRDHVADADPRNLRGPFRNVGRSQFIQGSSTHWGLLPLVSGRSGKQLHPLVPARRTSGAMPSFEGQSRIVAFEVTPAGAAAIALRSSGPSSSSCRSWTRPSTCRGPASAFRLTWLLTGDQERCEKARHPRCCEHREFDRTMSSPSRATTDGTDGWLHA